MGGSALWSPGQVARRCRPTWSCRHSLDCQSGLRLGLLGRSSRTSLASVVRMRCEGASETLRVNPSQAEEGSGAKILPVVFLQWSFFKFLPQVPVQLCESQVLVRQPDPYSGLARVSPLAVKGFIAFELHPPKAGDGAEATDQERGGKPGAPWLGVLEVASTS